MPTVRGKEAVRRFVAQAPTDIETKLLRGAARAAANVVADEARERTNNDETRGAIKVATKREEGRVIAKVQVKGPGSYLAPWEEYGTDPHFITVDDRERQGMSIGRINKLSKTGALTINGAFATTVLHPGAKRHPFLRPSLDIKAGEAIAAAQSFINSRVKPSGIVGPVDAGGDDA